MNSETVFLHIGVYIIQTLDPGEDEAWGGWNSENFCICDVRGQSGYGDVLETTWYKINTCWFLSVTADMVGTHKCQLWLYLQWPWFAAKDLP